MGKKAILFIGLIFAFRIGGFAQLRDDASDSYIFDEDYRQINASLDFNKPIGRMGFAYQYGIGTHIGFTWYESSILERVIRVNIGVTQFKPKADTLYYLTGPGEYGTDVYSNYFLITGTVCFFGVKRINRFEIQPGIDVGFGFSHYSCATKDKDIHLVDESAQGKLIVAPRLELGYHITEQFSLSLAAAHTGLISFGGSDIGTYRYNPVIGIYKQYASLSLKAGFSF